MTVPLCHSSNYVCDQASASRNLLIISNGDPENTPEYSEFLYVYENHWIRLLVCSVLRSFCSGASFQLSANTGNRACAIPVGAIEDSKRHTC